MRETWDKVQPSEVNLYKPQNSNYCFLGHIKADQQAYADIHQKGMLNSSYIHRGGECQMQASTCNCNATV